MSVSTAKEGDISFKPLLGPAMQGPRMSPAEVREVGPAVPPGDRVPLQAPPPPPPPSSCRGSAPALPVHWTTGAYSTQRHRKREVQKQQQTGTGVALPRPPPPPHNPGVVITRACHGRRVREVGGLPSRPLLPNAPVNDDARVTGLGGSTTGPQGDQGRGSPYPPHSPTCASSKGDRSTHLNNQPHLPTRANHNTGPVKLNHSSIPINSQGQCQAL